MKAIYKRELKAYFHSMTGWLFLAANIFLSGLYFFALNLRFGYSSLANTIYNILFLLLITIPILTMRMMSEERRQKTDQLILTSPVSVGRVVLGKYLAAATIFTLSTLELYGSAGLLFIWPDLYCHRPVYFFRDRKPGNRCGAELRRSFSGIYDGQYNRTDFYCGKSAHPDFECL